MFDDRITELFGFDLGDGESAVAWAREGSKSEPQLIEIAGRKSVLTAYGEHPEMGALIGEQAYLAGANELFLRFKSKFLTDRDGASRLLRKFIEAVKAELMKSGKLTDPDAAAFFVGCPSGWDEAAREDYQKLFLQAGLKNVSIVSESRAAFMFVRESGELNVPDVALGGPTLIIDAGSSTTDFTFINQLKTVRAFDFGETRLGGGVIDALLLQANLSRCPIRDRLEAVFARYPQYQARAELEARKVKEMYFTRRAQSGGAVFSVPCESSVKLYAERPPLTLDLSCDDADMERILNQQTGVLSGESYLGAYGKCLLGAKKQLTDTPPELILLTGGASRMDFIEAMAREAFPSAQLLHGAEPEYSIARGLCYALRIDRKSAAFEREIKALIESDQVEEIILSALPDLFFQLAPVIVGGLIDECAVDAFRQWKAGEIKTLSEMSGAIKTSLEQSLSAGEIHENLRPVMRGWLEEIRPELEALTDPITARYELPLASLRLPPMLSVDAVQLDLSAGDILNFSVLQTLIDVMVGSIVAMIMGGSGTALLMAGPVGLVLSFAIGFVASRLGTGYAKKHLDHVELPMLLRKVFTTGAFKRQLEGQREALERQFADQFIALIDPPAPAVTELIHAVSGAIETQLGQLADQARLLIH